MSILRKSTIEPPPPPSGSPRARKRRCRFHNTVFVKEIPSHRIYSPFEKQLMWYTSLDYRCFKLAAFLERYPEAFGDVNQPEANTQQQLHGIYPQPPPRTYDSPAYLTTNLPLYSPPLQIKKEPKSEEFTFSTVNGNALNQTEPNNMDIDQPAASQRHPPKRVISMGEKVSLIRERQKLQKQREEELRRLSEGPQHVSTPWSSEVKPKPNTTIQQEQRQETPYIHSASTLPPQYQVPRRDSLLDVGYHNSILKNADHIPGFGTTRNTSNILSLQLCSKQLYALPNTPSENLPAVTILDSALAMMF